MNWKKTDNLTDYGVRAIAEIKKIPLGDSNEEYQIYRIPLNLLKYNSNNGRIFMEVNRLKVANEIDLVSLEQTDVDEFNKEIEKLIWDTTPDKNEATLRDIEKYTQLESGVILSDGTVIDGNRRFTCLRRLHEMHPLDERFDSFNAAIIFTDDSTISKKDIKRFELRVQFGRDEKVDYKAVNFAMSIYQEIKSGEFTIKEIADSVNKSVSDITKMYNTCKLIEDFLEYTNQSGQLYIAEELNIYWPLEPLGAYLNGEGSKLSEVEKIRRKHLFYDYLLSIDIPLPTQEFRDNLIKKIFKDQVLWSELATTYENESGPIVNDQILQNKDTPEEFVERVKRFRKTEDSEKILSTYRKKVEKKNMETMANAPVKISEEALERLRQINIEPLIAATSSAADANLKKIKNMLDEATQMIGDLQEKIVAKLECK